MVLEKELKALKKPERDSQSPRPSSIVSGHLSSSLSLFSASRRPTEPCLEVPSYQRLRFVEILRVPTTLRRSVHTTTLRQRWTRAGASPSPPAQALIVVRKGKHTNQRGGIWRPKMSWGNKRPGVITEAETAQALWAQAAM